jgi:hypothetical protein
MAKRKIITLVKVNGMLVPKKSTSTNKFKAFHASKKPVSLAKVELPPIDWYKD